jgi:prepilin-type N-terminal cleavage/methylation domain-containing protein
MSRGAALADCGVRTGAPVAPAPRIAVRSQPPHSRLDAGFSLVEVMIATVLLATSLTALAELFVISVRNNAIARNGTLAAVLAAQKVEQLRAANPTPSAANTLQVSTDGYVDYLDPNGATVGDGGAAIPENAAYIRRWSIEAVPASSVFVLQVLVTRRRDRGVADEGMVTRAPEEARVITAARHRP